MSIEQDILTDLQSRTQGDSGLLAMVEAGKDADVAAWYNDQEGTPTTRPARLTKDQLMDALGFEASAGVLAKLRAFAAGEAGDAGQRALINEAVRALDFRDVSPDFGDAATRGILDDLATGTVITTGERDALKSLGEHTPKLAETLFGRPIRADDVSDALRPVRVDGTTTLQAGWQE